MQFMLMQQKIVVDMCMMFSSLILFRNAKHFTALMANRLKYLYISVCSACSQFIGVSALAHPLFGM